MSPSKFAFDRGGTPVELLPGEIRIGSDVDCSIRVEGEKVEPLQAVVVVDESGAVLHGRGSKEDIRINGMPSRVAELNSGDKVRFGDLELTLSSSAEGQVLSGPSGSYNLKSGENGVGRTPEGALVLNDASVSREHALVVVLPGLRVLVRDLHSSNGTFVNDRRLGEVPLKTGDTVEIGPEKLVFVEAKLPGAPATPAPAAGSSPLEFKLLVGTEVRPLSPGTVTIGRSPDRDIPLKDNEVSGSHAELTVGTHEVRLRDVGSSNGTRVNGNPISSEVVLKDTDTITVGSTDLMFMAPSVGGGFDKTVLSGSAPDLGKTVVSAAPPAGVSPALAALDLEPGASQEVIQRKFRELFSDYQVRLTNAPTPELKNRYQAKIDELQMARDELIAPASAGGGMDLPSAEPVHESSAPEPVPHAPVEVSEIPSEPQEPKKKRAAAKEKRAAKKEKKKAAAASGEGGLPKSAVIMIVISVVAVLLSVVVASFAKKAIAAADGVQAKLAAKQAGIVAMQERIPEAEAMVTSLQEGRVALLENAEFKICNLSSGSIWVVWLHSTYVGRDGQFRSFDSAFEDYESWEVPAGGTTKFNYVKDDRVVWDGSTVFFSLLMQYRGQETFRSGAWSAIGSDCYNLALDP